MTKAYPNLAGRLRRRLVLGLVLAGPAALVLALELSHMQLSTAPGGLDRARGEHAVRIMRSWGLGLQSGWVDSPEFLTGPGVDLVRVFGSPPQGNWSGSTVLATEVRSGWPLRCLVGSHLARVIGPSTLAPDAVYVTAVPSDTACARATDRSPIVPLGLNWAALIVDALAIWPATFLVVSIPMLIRRAVRVARRQCAECGYARAAGRPCPECGAGAATGSE